MEKWTNGQKCRNWNPFKGQIAASLLAAQFSRELGIRIKIRKSTLNFQGNVDIGNTDAKNFRKSTLNFQGNVDKSMEGQIEQIGLCLLTMGETRISGNSGNK